MLDASKLARVITQPLFPLSYKQEKDMKFRDTIVTLLIDNSGSMREGLSLLLQFVLILWLEPLRDVESKLKSWVSLQKLGKVVNQGNNG